MGLTQGHSRRQGFERVDVVAAEAGLGRRACSLWATRHRAWRRVSAIAREARGRDTGRKGRPKWLGEVEVHHDKAHVSSPKT